MKALPLFFTAASMSVLLTGCNFYLADIFHDSPKQANNGFGYLSTEPDQKKFMVDQSKSNFNFNNKYFIKDATKNPDDAVIGRSVDITTPVQVVSVIPGSVTQVKDNHAILRVDTLAFDYPDLDNKLMERLIVYLRNKNISLESVDAKDRKMNTGWYTSDYSFNKITPERLSEDEDIVEYRTKYAVSVTRNDANHYVQMDVELTNIKAYHESRRIYLDTSEFVQNRFASFFLKDFMDSLITERHHSADAGATVVDRAYHTVTLGKDANNQYAWVVSGSFDAIWPKFIKMLPKYGFAILFEEKIRGIVDTNYDEEDEDFFLEQGVDNFVIEDDKYRFQVGVKGEDTIITIFNNDKQPLADELFLKMYGGFAKALEKELN